MSNACTWRWGCDPLSKHARVDISERRRGHADLLLTDFGDERVWRGLEDPWRMAGGLVPRGPGGKEERSEGWALWIKRSRRKGWIVAEERGVAAEIGEEEVWRRLASWVRAVSSAMETEGLDARRHRRLRVALPWHVWASRSHGWRYDRRAHVPASGYAARRGQIERSTIGCTESRNHGARAAREKRAGRGKS